MFYLYNLELDIKISVPNSSVIAATVTSSFATTTLKVILRVGTTTMFIISIKKIYFM